MGTVSPYGACIHALSIDLSLAQKREDQRLHVVVPRVSKQDQLLEVSWECTRLAVEAEEPCQISEEKALERITRKMISLLDELIRCSQCRK